MNLPPLRILWAVDVFDPARTLFQHQVDALGSLEKSFEGTRSVEITPVTVLSPEQLDLQVEFTQPWLERYLPQARQALDDIVRQSELKNLAEPRIATHQRASARGSVLSLLDYAKTLQTDLIVVGSHGRHGLQRLFLGSFTETLLTHSTIPVLTVGHAFKPVTDPQAWKRALFSTDLTGASRAAFDRFLPWARDARIELDLVHLLTRPMEPIVQSGLFLAAGSWVTFEEFLEVEREEKLKLMKNWEAAAAAQKVRVRSEARDVRAPLVDEIIRAAEARGDSVIALASQSGPVAAGVLGSIVRQLVRGSPVPVWSVREPLAPGKPL